MSDQAIPPQASVWDEHRNTSRVFPVAPGAADAAIRACRHYAGRYPRHARWLLDGHPTLTEAEHYERFGAVYKKGDLS